MKLDAYSKQLIAWAKEIVAYLIASGVSPSDAEDVVQDVFIKLLEAEFVLPGHKIRAWMYRVSVRRYIDRYRRDKRYQEILQTHFFGQEDLVFFDQGDYDWVREEVKQLPATRQAVVDLYYFQGFSVGEIAHIIGASTSKVKMDLARGRSQLKETLEKAGYKDGNI